MTPEEINEIAALHTKQWREACGTVPKVTCPCGLNAPIRFLYRCLYCGIWFCERCAEAHFGKTKAEHRAEHPELYPMTTAIITQMVEQARKRK